MAHPATHEVDDYQWSHKTAKRSIIVMDLLHGMQTLPAKHAAITWWMQSLTETPYLLFTKWFCAEAPPQACKDLVVGGYGSMVVVEVDPIKSN